MSVLSEIGQLARAAQAHAEPCWLATVMRVRGSAYRHAGARLLFSSGEILAGSVSGGCLEASIVRKGPWLARERAVCVRYEGSREEDDDEESPRGTGCDGTVDILLERVNPGSPSDPLTFIHHCLGSESRGVLLTVFESSHGAIPVGARLALGEAGELTSTFTDESTRAALSWVAQGALRETHPQSRIVHGAGFEALLEVILPAPQLFLFGTGPDALKVVEFSRAVGFGVTVCEPNPRPSVRERFSDLAELHLGSVEAALPKIEARRTALGVVMSHHYATDSRALAMLLESRALYIGMLGPRRRTERMLSELQPNREPSAADRGRVRAPIGLDLGSETPAQIALSIVAEMQAVLARASAEPLSQRMNRPIHSASPELTLTNTPHFARTGTR